MADNTHSIFSLPAEVIEHIFIAASAGASGSIAALAQTCKSFHAIIYHAPDHHLWRGVFLAAFDDPRPAIRHTAVLRRGARYDDPRALQDAEDAYDWAGEYQRRIKARAVLGRAARRRTDVKGIPLRMHHRSSAVTDEQRAQLAGPTPEEGAEILAAFNALLATLETASPFPRFPSIKFEVHQGLLEDPEEEASFSRAPPFPPLLLLLCSDEFPESMQCANTDWVQDVLDDGGFPPQLVRTLLANRELHVDGCPDFTPNLEQPAYWMGPAHELGQAFHKLLCCTGFIPIRQPEPPAPKVAATKVTNGAESDSSNPSDPSTEPAHTTTETNTVQPESPTSTSASSTSSPAPGITMEEPSPTNGETEDADGDADGEEADDGSGVYGLTLLRALEYTDSHALRQRFPSAERQHTEARSLARRRVYDMRYLHPTRQWGPYLPVKRPLKAPAGAGALRGKGGDGEDDGARAREGSLGAETESSEEEYVPPPVISIAEGIHADDEYEDLTDEDEDHEEDDEDDDDDDGEGLHALPLAHNLRPLRPPIQPYELTPDWVWLASARIVVEANLGEMYHRSATPDRLALGDIMYALRQTQTTRLGSSPGFWNEWTRQRERAEGKGKGKETAEEAEGRSASGPSGSPANGRASIPIPKLTGDPEDLEECEGWDWAGIAGVWRRCICWLDYRDLLLHNVSSQRFLDESTREACRMVPMTARIIKYTRAPQPPNATFEYPPIIHVEGESIGSDRDPRAPRRNWGKVMMLADGSIRWHMETRTPGSDEPEWSSEAIQIGGPGAASGWLGCWTGAQHERPDPLGPFWAWKVG